MKKSIFAFFVAMTAVLALNAESYTGTIYVTRNGETQSETVTVTTTEQSNGLNNFNLQVTFMGMNMSLNMVDVPSATTGDITVYSSEQDVTTYLGKMYTILFARVTNGMMAANVDIPAYGVTMWFNTVNDHFQLPNSDMEAWTNDNGEPDRWHGFKTATGTWAFAAPALLGQSEDVHEGATGQYSAIITAKSAFTTIANGTMTNGRLNAGSTSATSTSNNASMNETYGDDFYMPLYAKPDQFKVWLKYQQGTANANNKASVSVKTFDGTYYQEPVDKNYTNLSGSIVGGQISAGDWAQYTFPFDYDSYAANNADSKAIFVTFSTNANPGQGSSNDKLFIDDIQLVYLGNMTDLRYQGTTINGWNPAVTTYNIEVASEPNLNDFDATIEGASAVLTKTMEKTGDNTYRIAISVVAGDLQEASCYIINATVTSSVMLGDVNNDGKRDISDATALINYLLYGTEDGINLVAANVNEDSAVDISDATTLINWLLYGVNN